MLQRTAAALRHATNHPLLLNKNYMVIAEQMSVENLVNMSAKLQLLDRLLPKLL